MILAQRFWLKLQTLLGRNRSSQRLDDEIQFHLAQQITENLAAGMSPEEARYAAMCSFGNSTCIKEETRDTWGWTWIEHLAQDLRYSARMLRKSPGFTTIAIFTLALGIGANTAIFQLIDAIRLRTLPVKNPSQLAIVHIENRDWLMGSTSGPYSHLTFPLYEQIRQRQQAFSAIAAWGQDRFNLSTGGEVHFAQGIFVSGDFFQVLGVQPFLGRLIAASDDEPGCGSGVVDISYAFWQRQYGGQPYVIGRKLTLDGHPFEIIGVTPPSFHGVSIGDSFDVAVPICSEPAIRGYSFLKVRHAWWLATIGRLKPGWSIEKATAQLKAISPASLQETIPPLFDADGVKHYLAYRFAAFPASTGFSALREQSQTPLWLLLAISGLVLLIACANLANLMLARATTREREIVVRVALGARRSRLIRQLLSESLLVSVLGALCGAILAVWLSQLLVSMMSTPNDPVFLDLTMDWRVLGFAAVLAIFTTVLFGLAPAVRFTGTRPSAALRSVGRGMIAGRQRFGLRRILVITQVALSLVLLVSALLFVRSFRKLVYLDAGFRQDGILIAHVDFTQLNLPAGRWLEFRREILERIRAIPGVQSAADANRVPIGGSGESDPVLDDAPDQRKGTAWYNYISPHYFETLETPLLAGRDFDDRDTTNSAKVAIVNERFAKQFLGRENAVGKTFRIWVPPGTPVPLYQVVGIVKDTKYMDLHEELKPIMYFPLAQEGYPWLMAGIFIRSDASLYSLISSVKTVLSETNPSMNVDFRVFKTQIRESLLQDRLMAGLSSFFGFLAALLAAIGLYGVISYMVSQRTNEIGIRMALGARRGNVLRMILHEAGTTTLIGLGIGTVLALAAAQVARGLLFDLEPRDPLTIGSAVLMLAAVAVVAAALPARRASRIDPMVALRYE